jgi:ABC-type nitrate/sulfonate/bicarbonate transport system permease component
MKWSTAWLNGLVVFFVLASWEWLVGVMQVPVYLLPSPLTIVTAFGAHWRGLLVGAVVTTGEALAGLVLGSLLGLLLAMCLNFWERLEPAVMAVALFAKSTPLIAIAPILTIWLGFGPAPKVVITALITFFPVLVNSLTGLRAADPAVHAVMQSWHASRWEVFVHLRWRAQYPYLLAALKSVAPLSLVGAVVAEWLGASSGLGQLMWLAYNNLNLPLLFAAAVVLALIGSLLYQVVVLIERRMYYL